MRLSPLVVWDGVLFLVLLLTGALLRFLPGKAPLRRLCGGRLLAGSLLFAAAVPLDLWKAGLGVAVAMAGMLALLGWCLVTLCRHMDEDGPD